MIYKTLPSFALVATYSEQKDVTLPPTASLVAYPSTAAAHQPIYLMWDTMNVSAIQVTANNGVDPAFDTGLLATLGSGIYAISGGFSVTTMLFMTVFDASGNPVFNQTIKVIIQ